MKKMVFAIGLVCVTCLPGSREYITPKHGETASVTLKNLSGKDFILGGAFLNSPQSIKNNTDNSLSFKYDINNQGPKLQLIIPNDLILFAENTDQVEAEIKKNNLNNAALKNHVKAHIDRGHSYYTLEAVSGLRRGEYTANPNDQITIEPSNASVVGSSGFKSSFKFVKKNI